MSGWSEPGRAQPAPDEGITTGLYALFCPSLGEMRAVVISKLLLVKRKHPSAQNPGLGISRGVTAVGMENAISLNI